MRSLIALFIGIGALDAQPERLIAQNAPPPQSLSVRNTSKYLGKDVWQWTIFITGPTATVGQIREVEYTLHPTFPEPVQRVTSRGDLATPFALTATGWGTFTVAIRVTFLDGRTVRLSHPLSFVAATTPPCLPDITMNQQRYMLIDDGRFNRDLFVYVGDIKDVKTGRDRPVSVVAFRADPAQWNSSGRLVENDFNKRLASTPPRARWRLVARGKDDSIQFEYGDKLYLLRVQQLRTTVLFDRITFRICER